MKLNHIGYEHSNICRHVVFGFKPRGQVLEGMGEEGTHQYQFENELGHWSTGTAWEWILHHVAKLTHPPSRLVRRTLWSGKPQDPEHQLLNDSFAS